MDWRDEGVLLAVRKHGESAAIIEVFTPSRGRHAGVVRGGAGRRMAPVLQPGAQLDVAWRARLEDHLGAYTVEPLQGRAAEVMGDPLALAGLDLPGTARISQKTEVSMSTMSLTAHHHRPARRVVRAPGDSAP